MKQTQRKLKKGKRDLIIISNRNADKIEENVEYDEKYNLWRINIKLKEEYYLNDHKGGGIVKK